MDFRAYQEKAKETAIYPRGFEVIYPALGLANEAGEVLGKIKKVLRDKDGKFDVESRIGIASEMGDVLWYLAALAEDLDLDLEEIALANLEKLSDRKERGVLGGDGDNR